MIRAALLLFSLPLAAQPGSSILARGFHSELEDFQRIHHSYGRGDA
jgi:hypothetical protein